MVVGEEDGRLGSELVGDTQSDIHGQTAQIRWSELERFFAAGQVIRIDASLDLVKAAVAVTQDNAHQVQQWVEAELFIPVTDAQARDWQDSNPLLWSVVTAPWILVQQREC